MSHFLKRTLNLTSQEKLAGGTSDQAQEASAGHPQTATAAPPSARVVKNFLSMMDVEGPSRGGGSGGSRRMEHGAPRLRQLLGSGPLAADAVAAS
jgi:plant G-box-binding factor